MCDAQAADARPAPDVATLTEVTRPSTTADGQHAPALRFADPRVMAAMTAIVGFTHLLTGFDNKTLAQLMGSLLDAPYGARQATYDLRRFRLKGIIERIEHPPLPPHPTWPRGLSPVHQDLRASPRPGPGPAQPGASRRTGHP